MLIGAYADRAGRKPAMLLTIALITLGTAGLALTPSYASIGIAAPIFVVFCRLVQGLALGGEVGPSTAYLIEIAPQGQRGFYSSWQLASQGMSAMAAGLIGYVLSSSLTLPELTSWGWRVPFVLCIVLIPIAIYLRSAMPETLHGAGAEHVKAADVSLRGHSKVILLAILVILGGTISTYISIYMTTYALTQLKLPPTMALLTAFISGTATMVFALAGGWLSDKYGRRPLMIWPRVALVFVTVPLFTWLIAAPSAATLYITVSVIAALTALNGAAAIAMIPELLPRPIRALGLSIAYAVGVAIFGGTTQFVVTWLIGYTGNPAAPAWYVVVTSIISLLAMFALPESKDRVLES